MKPAILNAAGFKCYCSDILANLFSHGRTIGFFSSHFSNASVSHLFFTTRKKIVEPVPAQISVLKDASVLNCLSCLCLTDVSSRAVPILCFHINDTIPTRTENISQQQ